MTPTCHRLLADVYSEKQQSAVVGWRLVFTEPGCSGSALYWTCLQVWGSGTAPSSAQQHAAEEGTMDENQLAITGLK